jgi:hypothetical protein
MNRSYPLDGCRASGHWRVGASDAADQLPPASGQPPGSGVQTPAEPGSAHDEHGSAHAVAQQIPRAQWPDRHCVSLSQVRVSRRPHDPPAQLWVAAHSLSALQDSRHRLVAGSQVKGAQATSGPCAQLPVPSQYERPLTRPSAQLPAAQSVPTGAGEQVPSRSG